jgi:hypothetical protein
MNYCSINEAWGKSNYISNQYKKMNTNSEKVIKNKKKHIEKFTNTNKKINSHRNKINHCDSFVTHLKSCSHCRNKVREQFKPKILENFEDMIQTNRETIVLILIGLCLMIFFNMIMNVTSK